MRENGEIVSPDVTTCQTDNVLQHILVADRDTRYVVCAILLQRLNDSVALPRVWSRVCRNGVVAKPDGHVNLRLVNGLKLSKTTINAYVRWHIEDTRRRTTNSVWLQSAPYSRICCVEGWLEESCGYRHRWERTSVSCERSYG